MLRFPARQRTISICLKSTVTTNEAEPHVTCNTVHKPSAATSFGVAVRGSARPKRICNIVDSASTALAFGVTVRQLRPKLVYHTIREA